MWVCEVFDCWAWRVNAVIEKKTEETKGKG